MVHLSFIPLMVIIKEIAKDIALIAVKKKLQDRSGMKRDDAADAGSTADAADTDDSDETPDTRFCIIFHTKMVEIRGFCRTLYEKSYKMT